MSLLEVSDLHVAYGEFAALHGVTLAVEEGEIVAIIGANGAGKSTLLKAVAGLLPTQSGTIAFAGERVERAAARRRVDLGLALTLEGRRLFPEMTVEENLLVGSEIARARGRARANVERMYERFPVLANRRTQLAGTLSGGEQQMCAIARSLMSEPRMLMLDEPSLGLAPRITAQIFDLVVAINATGTTVVLVEQNVEQTLAIANRAYVLNEGTIAMSGAAGEVSSREEVRAAYLGEATERRIDM